MLQNNDKGLKRQGIIFYSARIYPQNFVIPGPRSGTRNPEMGWRQVSRELATGILKRAELQTITQFTALNSRFRSYFAKALKDKARPENDGWGFELQRDRNDEVNYDC